MYRLGILGPGALTAILLTTVSAQAPDPTPEPTITAAPVPTSTPTAIPTPVPTTAPVRVPFQRGLSATLSSNQAVEVAFTIPGGRRLGVEGVNAGSTVSLIAIAADPGVGPTATPVSGGAFPGVTASIQASVSGYLTDEP
ncbi:MAG: hypothetical protein HY329_15670 [Chloroflexi bacterium]|nr:hypothetical protein [Chloroflexota bacterium]